MFARFRASICMVHRFIFCMISLPIDMILTHNLKLSHPLKHDFDLNIDYNSRQRVYTNTI